MYSIAHEGENIPLSLLSQRMGVSTPTANSMVKRLRELGLVKYKKYKPLELTPEGEKMAGLILRKHRIAEMFLVEKLGFSWEEVHDVAEEIEHIHSEKFFDRMDEALGYPDTDPHGSPIPDRNGNISPVSCIKLSETKQEQTVKLHAIHKSNTDFLKYLNKKELSLGCRIKVEYIENFDQSMTVSYQGHPKEILSNEVCKRLLVKKVKG